MLFICTPFYVDDYEGGGDTFDTVTGDYDYWHYLCDGTDDRWGREEEKCEETE